MSKPKIKVSWGVPVLPGPKPGETLEERLLREAEDWAWPEKCRAMATRAIEALAVESRR